MASWQTVVSRRARTAALPTKYMRLVSPWKPSRITVTSILMMSPLFRRLSPGIPWQTTWFTEVQMVFGKAAVVEVGGNRFELVHDEIVAALVELLGGRPGLNERLDHVQHAGGQPAGGAHFVLFGGCFDGHGHRTADFVSNEMFMV